MSEFGNGTRLARLLGATALGIAIASVTACGGHAGSAAETTTSTTQTVAATPAQTPQTSGDPLYDTYAAAMRTAGIPFNADLYTGDYAMDKAYCKNMASGDIDAFNLVTGYHINEKPDLARRFATMISILCPDQQRVLDEALSPGPKKMRHMASGKYIVGYGGDSLGHWKIEPGTWKTGRVSNCYWERLNSQGDIIDNNMVSISESVVVTIAPTDAAFNSERCGEWTRVE